nr:unnamed protein product [Digitaria exilis]
MEAPSEASKGADAKPVLKPRPVAPTGRFALGTASSIKKRTDGAASAEVAVSRPSMMKSTSSVNASSVQRRSSTGTAGKQQEDGSSVVGKKASPTLSDGGAKKSKPVSATTVSSKPAVEKKTSLTDKATADLVKKPAVKASPTSTLKKVQSKTESSNGSSGSARRVASTASLQSPRSVASTATKKSETSSSVPSRRKSSTADSRDSRFMMLPQVDFKASDEVRLDSRGHRVRSLKQLRLSPALEINSIGPLILYKPASNKVYEFVYLRDNRLSSLEGIDILKGVKVLDLSFNDFKLPGFEPLGNCMVLQQLYLAGNQITSLGSLPELPNLEFLSVAQNRLKSLCMAHQPRLQVLAASRNKISTLKGFPHLPSLEHLRIEENPLLEMPHLEAASILLIGPTLKKFNDRDLNPNEAEVAKQYPAHTAICIRDGWEFCSPELAAGTGCPKVINLTVCGELVEGNILSGVPEIAWCGGTPGKGVASWLRRRWNGNAEVIDGAEGMEYQLTVNDINSSLVFMYTPVTDEGVKGKPQCTMTDFVKAARPSVSNVRVLGDIVEDNVIIGKGKYFGGREGLSKLRWFREKENGEFLLVLSDSMEYTLTEEDVGRHLKFVYTPVNLEGEEGESACALTDVVKKAPPKVFNLKIIGEAREGSKVSATATVTGGTEGSSRVQWYKASSSEFKNEHELEALSTSKVSKTFRIPLSAVGYYVVAKFTPVAPDGEIGEPSYAISDGVVETLPPSLNFLTVTGEYSEGQILTASYGYIGGHEGNSLYSWHLHESEDDEGTPVTEASGLLQYHISKEALGKFVSFKCTPIRDDGIVGEARAFIGKDRVAPGMPTLLSLEVTGEAIEGTTMVASKRYWGGEEGDTMFCWILASSDGTEKKIEGATSSSYTLKCDDIGFYISVLCKPVRNDGVHGSLVSTEMIGPIIPGPPACQSLELAGSVVEGGRLTFHAGYTGGLRGSCIHEWFRLHGNGYKEKLTADECLDLDLADVDCQIELTYTPVREDGLQGSPRSAILDIILPGEPKGIDLMLPQCFEDNEVSPIKTYFGGKEGTGKYMWFRNKEKLGNLEFDLVAASSEVIGETLKYKVSLDDVGSYLVLYWVPRRCDGKTGDPMMAITDDPVMAAFPSVSDVHLEQKSADVYCEIGRMYEANVDDVGYRLVAIYTPVREDGVEGQPISVSTEPIAVEPEIYKEVKQKLDDGSVKFEVLCDKDRTPKKAQVMGHLERRVLEVNRKRIKVVKPGSKTSFPTTEVRGTYAPPFHVELHRNDQHRFKIVVDGDNEVDLMVQTRHMRDVVILTIRGLAQKFNSTSLNTLLKIEA